MLKIIRYTVDVVVSEDDKAELFENYCTNQKHCIVKKDEIYNNGVITQPYEAPTPYCPNPDHWKNPLNPYEIRYDEVNQYRQYPPDINCDTQAHIDLNADTTRSRGMTKQNVK